MRIALIVLIAGVGVALTLLAAFRLWRASRSGAPRELQLGYLAMMLVASAVSVLLLRVL